MYRVAWDDYAGEQHELTFEKEEDARIEYEAALASELYAELTQEKRHD